jgi:starch synthase (maltosyl-transferring)
MTRLPAAHEPPPSRVVIERVDPEIDSGRFPVKRVVGDVVVVEASVYADGHDELSCRVLYRSGSDGLWQEAAMSALGNDRWRGEFQTAALGEYRYTVEGWIDEIGTWRKATAARVAAGRDVGADVLIGADILERAAGRAGGDDAIRLSAWARELRGATDAAGRSPLVLAEDVITLARRYPDRSGAGRYDRELRVVVDPKVARFSTWYEVFPRSCAPERGHHGTLVDCLGWLPAVAEMGFDVVYLPPIHPIGRAFRKGKNGTADAGPDDVGSPWAIGAREGGHTSIHPQLGTIDDFRRLVGEAARLGIEIALDLAFQCAPDHPYVTEHPEWFRHRPDGTIQHAENPPKSYPDIYPLDFECAAWRDLWAELRRVILFWTDQGVRIFRVDNPHTKALAFWEWVIAEVKARRPEVIFLAEAFTRPSPMYRLAKLGFSQSYTYFTWRNSKQELTDYFRELTDPAIRNFFRPNLWPNTPDILHEYLQRGGPPAFRVRAVLAATLGANYGIYGPAFELCEHDAREPGSEEYRNSEKYEIKHRDFDAPVNLRGFLSHLNRLRRENPALQSDATLRFHETDNANLICYSKSSPDLANVILTVVNLDTVYRQSGWVTLDLSALARRPDETYEVDDLLNDQRFVWQGARTFIALAPAVTPAHVLRVPGLAAPVRDAGPDGRLAP